MRIRTLVLSGLLFSVASLFAHPQALRGNDKAASFAATGKAASATQSQKGLSSLPADAQGRISAVLGRDDSRYLVHPAAGNFHAENPQHSLGVDFTSQGVEVRNQRASWGIELRGYGYGDALLAASESIPQAEGNRVEYRRGALTEWYVNGPAGLEQGFTLAEPWGKPNGQPLTVALALSGNLVATLEPSGTALLLKRDGQAALRYTGLTAHDATGRELRSWMELRGDRLMLRVEDRGASYPVVVDPFVQVAKLTASDGQPNDEFGDSVAISGNTIVVGAPNAGPLLYQGAAYVFVEPASGWATTSTFTAKLTASDANGYDFFGDSVAIDGDTVVAGQPVAPAFNRPGAVDVFVKPATGWVTSTETAKLTPSDGTGGDQFGSSVAISGNTIVAGAIGNQYLSSPGPGAAYVFVEPATGWATGTQTAELTASDGAAGDEFGWSVAIDGNTVVVGAVGRIPYYPITYPGAAYVFVEPTTGWANGTQTAELTASDGAGGDEFGFNVDINGGTVVAGAPMATIGSNAGQGAAYVFAEPGTGWATTSAFTAKLTASDGAAGDEFGYSVAIAGNMLVAAAPLATIGSNAGQGAAYVFFEPGTGWATTSAFTAKLTASDGYEDDLFGISLAIKGETVVSGAAGNQFGGPNTNGATYIYQPAAPSITKTFAAPTIPIAGSTGLSFTISNSNSFTSLTGVGFSDTLPAGLVVSTPNGLSGSCGGGTITVVAGSTSVSLSGATLAASSSCTFSVSVTGVAGGIQNNTTSVVTSNEGGNGGTASASIAVVAPPTIGKGFSALTIPIGGSTGLTFTINNPNLSTILTGIGFTDSLPAGLIVATPNGLTGSCSGGTITATAGSTSISLSGAALAGGAGCTFAVNVTGISAGIENNTTSNVVSSNGGIGGTASASITVVAPPSITKVFGAATIPLNSSTTLTFTIANTNSTVTLTGVSFTDTMPAGLTAISATPGCGGTVTVLPGSISLTGGTLLPDSACILTATVKGTTAGVWTNTTSVVTSIQGGNGAPATDSITVVAPPVISKAFATPTVLVGSSTGLTFTITNPNTTVALTGVGFSDNLPIGLVVSTPNGLTGSCGGGTITAAAGSKTISLSGATLAAEASCTFAVNVTGTTAGTDVNTTSAVTSSNGGNGNTASATVIVLAPALVNYFSNAHTAGAQDASVRITNPNTSGGNLCADIFVFDANEEMSECCSCTTTPDGLLTLSVNTDVTGNPLTGKSLSTGLIVIVPAAAIGGLCPLPTAMTPEPALRAWGTHIQTDSSGFVDTETESQNTGLSAANLTALKNQCAAIKTVGSGHGVCANSAALAGICNN